MLDELPSLELAATAVAVVLSLRVLVLLRQRGLVRRQARVDSARARDLIGLAVLVGAALYAERVHRASSWFLVASGAAIVAQIAGFFLRARRRRPGTEPEPGPAAEYEFSELEGDVLCGVCGNEGLIELVDTARFLDGLSRLSRVSASVCPACGALSGQVEEPSKVPIGAEHGTALRRPAAGEQSEALEEPQEHDG